MTNTIQNLIPNPYDGLNPSNKISDIFLKDTKRQYITGLLLILFGIVLLSIGQN